GHIQAPATIRCDLFHACMVSRSPSGGTHHAHGLCQHHADFLIRPQMGLDDLPRSAAPWLGTRVVDDVGALKDADRLEGQQLGITRPYTYCPEPTYLCSVHARAEPIGQGW